ncbi:MAG: PIG-L deacetylase family protein [Planctomycetota bacterium]
MSAFDQMPPAPPEPRRLDRPPAGPVLAFAPHPDDEIAGPGGALCLHRRAGDPVRVVVATDGIAGDPDRRFDRATYTDVRRDESRRGLAVLGVHDVEFWGFPDSCQLSTNDLQLGLQHATASLQAARPRTVYLPWANEGHPDHHALHHVVLRALDAVGFDGLALGYEVWNAMLPDVVLDVTEVMAQKEAAMRTYESQTAYVQYDHCVRGLNAYRSLVHGRGKGYWEAYCVLRGALN